jgi:cytochrome c oxidase subunit IV
MNNNLSINQGLSFATLVALALLGVGVTLLHLSAPTQNVLVFAVAFLMAAIVVLQYMGLRWEGPLVIWTFLIPVVLFAILVIALVPDIAHICPAFLGKL